MNQTIPTTTKRKNYAFLWIALACVLIITVISIVNFTKPIMVENSTINNVKGYLLTNDGIDYITNEDNKISKTSVINNSKITNFDLTKTSIIYQESVEEDSKNVNIFLYDLDTKKSHNIVSSDESYSYTKVELVGNSLLGTLVDDNTNLTRQLKLINLETNDNFIIKSPTTTEDNSIIDWAVSPSGDTLSFKDSTDSIYLYNIKTKEITLIGNFNNIFGYLNDGTVWLSNIEDDKKLTLYNVNSKQQKPVILTEDIQKITFLNGTLLSKTQPETTVWSTSGFYGTDTAAQKIISISNGKTDIIFDLTAAGFKFSEPELHFDKNDSLVIVSAVDNMNTSGILFISLLTGDVMASIPGKYFILTE